MSNPNIIHPESEAERPNRSWRERLIASRLGRTATGLVAAAASLFAFSAVESAAPAYADGLSVQTAPDDANIFVPSGPKPWDLPTTSEHHYVDRVVWADTDSGKSLHVYMTGYGKAIARFNPVRAFNEAERDAHLNDGGPLAGTLKDQFVCHAEFAPPSKASWNLDTWRPDPGTFETANNGCNPGGSVNVLNDIG